MDASKAKLAGLENVSYVSGFHPRLMEIADPAPDYFYQLLTREELAGLMEISLRYQNQLVDIEMTRLKAQAEVLGQMQKAISQIK